MSNIYVERYLHDIICQSHDINDIFAFHRIIDFINYETLLYFINFRE